MSEETPNYEIQTGDESNPVKIDLSKLEGNNKEIVGKYLQNNWRNFIEKEHAEHSSTASLKTLSDLAKSYTNQSSLIGRKGLIVPTEKDAPEVHEAFFKALGRPDKSDEYDLPIPDGVDIKDTKKIEEFNKVKKEFADKMFSLGISRGVANKLWSDGMKDAISIRQAAEQKRKETNDNEWAELRKEYGASFDEKVNIAQSIIPMLPHDTVDRMKSKGFFQDADLVKSLVHIAGMLSEDKLKTKLKSTTSNIPTPAEAMAKANEIRTNKNNPLYDAFWTKGHPRHKEAVDEVNKLYKYKYPEEVDKK